MTQKITSPRSKITSPRPKTGHRPYQKSNWSFGWNQSKPQKQNLGQNSSFMKYHNQSSFVLQDKYSKEDECKKVEVKRKKCEQINAKLPTFDPRDGHRDHIVFGNQKPYLNEKSSGMVSPRIPPGGRSQIQFG